MANELVARPPCNANHNYTQVISNTPSSSSLHPLPPPPPPSSSSSSSLHPLPPPPPPPPSSSSSSSSSNFSSTNNVLSIPTLAAHNHPPNANLGSNLPSNYINIPSKPLSICSKPPNHHQIQSLGDLQLLISSSSSNLLASKPPSNPVSLAKPPSSPNSTPCLPLHNTLNLAPIQSHARIISSLKQHCTLPEPCSLNFSKVSSTFGTNLSSSMTLAEPPSYLNYSKVSRSTKPDFGTKLSSFMSFDYSNQADNALLSEGQDYIPSSSKLLPKLPFLLSKGLTNHRDNIEKNMVEAARDFRIGTTIPSCGGETVKKKRDFNSTMVSEPKDFDSTRVNNRGNAAVGTGRSGQRTKIQRENHILAERQRREEMNDKFGILRSLINKSSKKDKASIVGDTIDYILELEEQLKHLQRSTIFNKCNKNNNTTEAANDQNYETLIMPKVSNPPSLISNYTSSEDKSESAKRIKQVNQPSASNSISDDTLNFNHMKAIHSLLCEDQFSSAPSKSSSPSQGEQGIRNENCRDMELGGNVQVEVQNLGKQAVIKVVCAKSKGLVLRILAALEECKLEILQSNVTTIDHQVVHFLTIEMTPGVSASLQQMENALRVAASNTWNSEQHWCHKLESKYAYLNVLHSIR